MNKYVEALSACLAEPDGSFVPVLTKDSWQIKALMELIESKSGEDPLVAMGWNLFGRDDKLTEYVYFDDDADYAATVTFLWDEERVELKHAFNGDKQDGPAVKFDFLLAIADAIRDEMSTKHEE